MFPGGEFPGVGYPGVSYPAGDHPGVGYPGPAFPADGHAYPVGALPPIPDGYAPPAGWVLVPAGPGGGPAGTPAVSANSSPAKPGLSFPRATVPQFPAGAPAARSAPPSMLGGAKPVTPAAARLNAITPAAGPAKMTFHVPATAAITVDGYPVPGAGQVRRFHTPDLAAGERYFYEFRAEVKIDGRTVVETKRVELRAGDDLSESFPKLTAAAAAR